MKSPADDEPGFYEYLELRKKESEDGSPESVYEAVEEGDARKRSKGAKKIRVTDSEGDVSREEEVN